MLLSDLVEQWEVEHAPIPPTSGVALIKVLLEERGLPDRALVPIFGNAPAVSAVLHGKRQLQAKHIEQLPAFFRLSPDSFFPMSPTP